MNHIQRVWIEDGCICCQACVISAPEVFCIPEHRAAIRGAVRSDGITSPNDDECCTLNAAGLAEAEAIAEAVAGCPIDIIRFSA